jgi:hypothetical protein
MSGQLPSFLSGSNVVVRIGAKNLAYCQDLRFSRTVGHVPVRGIGSYGTLALEPVDFSINGSLVITRWVGNTANNNTNAPEGVPATTTFQGNSLFTNNTFNPATLILSATFDIYVYPKDTPTVTATSVSVSGTVTRADAGTYLYRIADCRLTNYSFSFFPGQLLNENATFIGRTIINGTSVTAV